MFCSAFANAQNFEKLSTKEINENKTPRAIAYNFIKTIIDEDYQTMLQYTSQSLKDDIYSMMADENISISQLFSNDQNYIHDIVDMRPFIKNGNGEWVIVGEGVFDCPFEGPYKGLPLNYVDFECVNTKQTALINQGDSNVEIYLMKADGKWKIFGFK